MCNRHWSSNFAATAAAAAGAEKERLRSKILEVRLQDLTFPFKMIMRYRCIWYQEMQNCRENLKIKSNCYILKIYINGIIEKLWKYHHSLQSTVRTLKKPSLGTIFSEILTRFPRVPRPWGIPRIMSYPTHLTYPVDLVSASCASASVVRLGVIGTSESCIDARALPRFETWSLSRSSSVKT